MNVLNKRWVRILISLVLASFASEFNHQYTGDPKGLDNMIFPIAFLFYVLLGVVVYFLNMIKAMQLPEDKEELDADLIDE